MAFEKYKPDWNFLRESIERRGIECLYHYTLAENFPSILDSGMILSRELMKEKGIEPATIHGWGKKIYDLENYCCLGFTPHLSMLKKEERNIIIFSINVRVTGYEGTCFSPMNSAKSVISSKDVIGRIDIDAFDGMFKNHYKRYPVSPQAEVLVPHGIAMKDVECIYFNSKDEWKPYRWKWLKFRMKNIGSKIPEIDIDPSIFVYPV